jgi:hypothetical protein
MQHRLQQQLQKTAPVLSLSAWKVVMGKQFMQKAPSTSRKALSGKSMS